MSTCLCVYLCTRPFKVRRGRISLRKSRLPTRQLQGSLLILSTSVHGNCPPPRRDIFFTAYLRLLLLGRQEQQCIRSVKILLQQFLKVLWRLWEPGLTEINLRKIDQLNQKNRKSVGQSRSFYVQSPYQSDH